MRAPPLSTPARIWCAQCERRVSDREALGCGQHFCKRRPDAAVEPRATPAGAGALLLADIEAWCARTGTAETRIGNILFRHAGFVGLLRKRGSLTAGKERIVRDFLAAHPDGLAEDASADDALRGLLTPAVLRAWSEDGRPLGTFVAALIEMGLECWRDDRAMEA